MPPPVKSSPSTLRLVAALVLPCAWTGLGMWVLRSVEATYVLHILLGCLAGPFLLAGAGRGGAGHPFLPARGRSRGALRRGALLWLLCGPVLVAAYALLRPWLGDAHSYMASLAELGWRASRFPLYATLFVLVTPLAEEWWWRGNALPRCEDRWGPRRGSLAASAAFTFYHGVVLARLYPADVVFLRLAAIFLAATLWGAAARRDRAWFAPFLGHSAADLAFLVVFRLFLY